MSPPAIPVVYVAGSGHSGSTLLALLLDSHPEIACVGETAVKPKIRRRGDTASAQCSCGDALSRCPFWQDVFARARALGEHIDHDRWPNDYRFEQPLAQRLLNRLGASPAGRRQLAWAGRHLPVYRSRVARIGQANVVLMRAALDAQGARVFADTSKRAPRLVHLLEVPALALRILHLVRDVRGYAASAKRRGEPPLDAARTWRRDQVTVRDIADAHPSVPYLRVVYEDLCRDPAATMSQVWRFCGVADMPPPEVVDAAGHHVLGNAMRMGGAIRIRLDQSWKERLSVEELRDVLAIAGDVNRDLGLP